MFWQTAPLLKHFLAHNNETARDTTSAMVRPRLLHEYELPPFRGPLQAGLAIGVMPAYSLVNGRPNHVSPLLGDVLRAGPDGDDLVVCSDAYAPSNLVDTEHYFASHPESHAAALRAGVDSFTDQDGDSSVTVARLSAALDQGLISQADVDRAARRLLLLRLRLGEFHPGLDPYRAGPATIDPAAHRDLARRAARASIVLLKNDAGLLPLDPAGPQLAVLGPFADVLRSDWYSGTMPYQVTVAAGLREALGGGESCEAAGRPEALAGVGRSGGVAVPDGADRVRVGAATPGPPDLGEFDVQHWGPGLPAADGLAPAGDVITLRSVATGQYLTAADDGSLAADQDRPSGWVTHETFALEFCADPGVRPSGAPRSPLRAEAGAPGRAGDGATGADGEGRFVVIRAIATGRYLAVDSGAGEIRASALDAAGAQPFRWEVLRDGAAEAARVAAAAGRCVLVLGNDPMINGRENQDRATLALPPAQDRLIRAVHAACPRLVLVVMRSWLQKRYGAGVDGLAELNAAWGITFWSQCYSAWAQVQPPRATQWRGNPGQLLDFSRFWSDERLAAYCEQRDEIRAAAPGAPVTTNLMLPDYQVIDPWAWSRAVDVVAVDHYLSSTGPDGQADIAFAADRARSWAGGRPWLLMEQATRLVYAGGRVLSRPPGRMLRDSLGYVARGSDSVLFFQWRASRAGAEMWHSAMLPHAGPDTAAFREVAALGAAVQQLGEVAGSTVTAQAAVLLDADSWWALDSQRLRGADLRYLEAVRRDYAALRRAGIVCDLAHPEGDLSGYRLLLAPALYLVTDAGAEALRRFVAGGGTLVVSFGSGLVDQAGQVRLGGYPGALRDLLGVRVEEFFPLLEGEEVPLSTGAHGRAWSELMTVTQAEVLASYAAGPRAGRPAVTRNDVGQGSAWYLSTQLDDAAHGQVIAAALAAAGLSPEVPGVEAVRRRSADGRSWLFLLNHTAEPATVPASGVDLLTGVEAGGCLELPPGGVAVVREVVAHRDHDFSVAGTTPKS